jgi:hypothetical protein
MPAVECALTPLYGEANSPKSKDFWPIPQEFFDFEGSASPLSGVRLPPRRALPALAGLLAGLLAAGCAAPHPSPASGAARSGGVSRGGGDGPPNRCGSRPPRRWRWPPTMCEPPCPIAGRSRLAPGSIRSGPGAPPSGPRRSSATRTAGRRVGADRRRPRYRHRPDPGCLPDGRTRSRPAGRGDRHVTVAGARPAVRPAAQAVDLLHLAGVWKVGWAR